MRFLPVGRRALLVELNDQQAVLGLYAEILRRREAGWPAAPTDVVPGATTVLLDGLEDPAGAASDIRGWPPVPPPPPSEASVEIPATYDGPDLEEVARRWGMTKREAVATHVATPFQVAFCGFSPGFAYLAGLPRHLAVPRRESPRPSVPAGSVALAGGYAAVYPRSSPGGWQLIGRTSLAVWDPARDPAPLLSPGTRVRFVEAGT